MSTHPQEPLDVAAAKRAAHRDWQVKLMQASAARDVARAGVTAQLVRLQEKQDAMMQWLCAHPTGTPLPVAKLQTLVLAAEVIRTRVELYEAATTDVDRLMRTGPADA